MKMTTQIDFLQSEMSNGKLAEGASSYTYIQISIY